MRSRTIRYRRVGEAGHTRLWSRATISIVRPEEHFAFEIIRRVLGVQVTPHDDGSEPRMVDGVFVCFGGGTGAVEVTTFGDPAALRSESVIAKLFGGGWTLDALQWSWIVNVGSEVNPYELAKRLPAALLRCEGENLKAYYWLDTPPDWLRWFEERDIGLSGSAETVRPGSVDVLPQGDGGGAPSDGEMLSAWINDELLVDPVVEKRLAKLLEHEADERHLVIRVDWTGLPFGVVYSLMADYAPTADPSIPAGLNGLWLLPRFGSPAVWLRRRGWQREAVLD